MQRMHANRRVNLFGLFDVCLISLLACDQLNQRKQVHWIERMRDDQAFRIFQLTLKIAGHDTRRRRRDNARRVSSFDLGVDLVFDIQSLWNGFDD